MITTEARRHGGNAKASFSGLYFAFSSSPCLRATVVDSRYLAAVEPHQLIELFTKTFGTGVAPRVVRSPAAST